MADSEIAIQTRFRSRVRIMCPGVSLVAIPNAAKRGQKAMNQARREGAAWGFPDMMALGPAGKVAFLEFKSAKGKLSDNQADWLAALERMGFPCGVFRTAEGALEFLRIHGFPFIGGAA